MDSDKKGVYDFKLYIAVDKKTDYTI